jgi:hypothetical protein
MSPSVYNPSKFSPQTPSQALLSNHDILALMTSEGREPAALFNRISAFMATLITVLYICCLSAPGVYLCPDERDDEWEEVADDGAERRRRLFGGHGIIGGAMSWGGVDGVGFVAAPDMLEASLVDMLKFLANYLVTGLFIGKV